MRLSVGSAVSSCVSFSRDRHARRTGAQLGDDQLCALGFYMGKSGGILNAILGSFYLAIGGTIWLRSLRRRQFFIFVYASPNSRLAHLIRLALDVMWGIPSIVYGAFGFAVMMAVGLRASLLADAGERWSCRSWPGPMTKW